MPTNICNFLSHMAWCVVRYAVMFQLSNVHYCEKSHCMCTSYVCMLYIGKNSVRNIINK